MAARLVVVQPGGDGGFGEGGADVRALGVVAAQGGQLGEGGLVLDAFGGDAGVPIANR